MKKVLIGLLALVMLVSLLGCVTKATAQPYMEVVDVPGKTADELFILANKWAVGAFVKADDVIEFSDKESGTISGKYSSKVPIGLLRPSAVSTILIEVKEGKYRISISDPYYIDPAFPEAGWKPLTVGSAVQDLEIKWKSIALDLKEYIDDGNIDW